MNEDKELIALTAALWWARMNLNFNCSSKRWKAYCDSLDYNIEFFLE